MSRRALSRITRVAIAAVIATPLALALERCTAADAPAYTNAAIQCTEAILPIIGKAIASAASSGGVQPIDVDAGAPTH